MNASAYHPQDPRANNPNSFSFQQNNHSGILLGNSSTNFAAPNVMYNSYFPGTYQQQTFNSQNPPVFMFRERKGKLNWRNIANLDVDDIIGRGDVRSLETHLSNITFSQVEQDDIEKFGDATLLKLFRLSQYGLEYLLNCQNYLSNQSQVLDNQYRHSEDRVRPLEDQARRNQSEILNLKSDIKEKKELIHAYQNTLNKPIFKCHICYKYFQNKEYLDQHFDRRHPRAQATPTEEKITKIVAREIATSPLIVQKPSKNRYGGEEESALESTNHATRVENGVQTLSTNATPDNSIQMQNSALLEKFIAQFKQDEDMKLSTLNSTIQDRLQELLRSNYELTTKLAELEKKIENQSQAPPTPQFEKTIRKPSGNIHEELSELEKRETPKKPLNKDLLTAGSEIQRTTTTKSVVLDQIPDMKVSVQTFRSGDLENYIEVKSHIQQDFRSSDLMDDDEADKQRHMQESLKGLIVKQSEEKEHEVAHANKKDIVRISNKQLFKSGDLEELMEEDEENIPEDPEIKKTKIIKQLFMSGELQADRDGAALTHSGGLEDDDDSTMKHNVRGSQEAEVIFEEELSPEKARKKYNKAIKKANKVLETKYQKEITPEQKAQHQAEIEKDLDTLSKKQLRIEWDHLPNQNNGYLQSRLTLLQDLNKDNQKDFQKIEDKFLLADEQPKEKEKKKDKKKDKKDKKEKDDEGEESPKFAKDKKKKAKFTEQSGELMNLLVNQEGQNRNETGNSQETTVPKKQVVYESTNLEQHLRSTENFKAVQNPHSSNTGASDPNLIKKSIENVVTESM